MRTPNHSSGVRRFDYLVQAVKRAGAGKLVFGSDGPWLHPALELEKIRLLRLPRAAEARVLGGNARKLIGLADVAWQAEDARAGAQRGTSRVSVFSPEWASRRVR